MVFKNKLNALIYILEILCTPANVVESDFDLRENPEQVSKLPALDLIEFDVGLELYADFIGASLDIRHDGISTRFRDDLLDPVHEIRCIIYGKAGKRFIILDSDHLDMHGIFEQVTIGNQEHDSSVYDPFTKLSSNSVDYAFIQQALKSMI